jgi:hypothetical protein
VAEKLGVAAERFVRRPRFASQCLRGWSGKSMGTIGLEENSTTFGHVTSGGQPPTADLGKIKALGSSFSWLDCDEL